MSTSSEAPPQLDPCGGASLYSDHMIAPCEPYITHEEFAACCEAAQSDESLNDSPGDEDVTEYARQLASSYLFYATGQQYHGLCDLFLRPTYRCQPCDNDFMWRPELIGGRWINLRCGDGCGCSERSYVNLYAESVTDVLAVYVDGEPLDENEWFYGNGRLYKRSGSWPTCQDLSRPAFPTAPDLEHDNTWGIHAIAGTEVPYLLKQATTELACHYYQECSKNCNTCRTTRDTVERFRRVELAFTDTLPWVYTGIATVDEVIRILNPYGHVRAGARIWTPEAQRTAVW